MTRERRQRKPHGDPARDEGTAPAPQRGTVALPATVAAAVSFLVYLRTLAPGMHFGDGCELAAASHVLGVPHPTGYPLYMMLLRAWSTVIPLGEVITRTAVFSAVCMAGAAGITVGILSGLLRPLFPGLDPKARVLTAGFGGLSSGFLRFHWENATVTEVYALQFLLAVACLACLGRFFATGRRGLLAGAAVAAGLGLAHHRLSVSLLPALALAIVWLWRNNGRRAATRWAAVCAAILMACLALYAYLPIRAAARPAINWGDPSTAAALLTHVRGGDYMQYRLLQAAPGQRFTAPSYAGFAARVTGQLLSDVVSQILPVPETRAMDTRFGRLFVRPGAGTVLAGFALLALAAGGFAALKRRVPWFAASAATAAAVNLVVILIYNIADIRDYYLVPFWGIWIAAICGAASLLSRIRVSGPARPEWFYAAALLPVALAASNWTRCDFSRGDGAETLSTVALPNDKTLMPEGSVLVTGGDQDIFTSWYRQLVRGERRDVLVVGSNFIHRPWYPAFFTKEQVAKYGLKFAGGTPVGADHFFRMVDEGILAPNVGKHPVFTTMEDPAVMSLVSAKYDVRAAARAEVEGMFGAEGPVPVTLWRIGPRQAAATPRR